MGILTKSIQQPLTPSFSTQKWLRVLDLPHPEHLITAESVENGKPDPTCYNLGRTRLSLTSPDKQVLVFEDSPAGIRSGKAAGCKVIGLVTSHTIEQVLSAEPDWIVRDLSSVKLVNVTTAAGEDGKQVVTGITLEVKDAFVVKK